MSSETAPLFTTSIFNQSNFTTPSSGSSNITTTYLDENYTKFPVAQTGVTQTIFDLAITQPNITVNNMTIGKGASAVETNTAFGFNTLSVATGTNNTSFGASSLTSLTSGSNNTGIGRRALNLITTPSNNTAVGRDSLLNTSTGGSNVGVGLLAGSGITTGSNNTILGYTDTTITGDDNTLIGYNIALSPSTISNTVAIGNNLTITASNQVVLGSSAYTSMKCSYLLPLYINPPTTNAGIGYSLSNTTTSSTSITLGVVTDLARITIQDGIWYIYAGFTANISATGSVAICINNQTDLTTTPTIRSSVVTSTFTPNYFSLSTVQGTNSNVTYRCLILCTSTGTTTVDTGAFIKAVRIG